MLLLFCGTQIGKRNLISDSGVVINLELSCRIMFWCYPDNGVYFVTVPYIDQLRLAASTIYICAYCLCLYADLKINRRHGKRLHEQNSIVQTRMTELSSLVKGMDI